jgi:GntR family transcriptional regulator, arabinose operon transcriptional repressor
MKTVALKPIHPEPGRPLYVCVKEAVREAIDQRVYAVGERLPSTKALAEQLGVSLVTVHRALQELVGQGVLRRGQGRGTFVHEAYLDRAAVTEGLRFGLVFHGECSLADAYHGQVLEGVRRGAAEAGGDLVRLRFGEDWRNECHGYLYVNPFLDQLSKPPRFAGFRPDEASIAKLPPIVVVGASWERPGIQTIDTDNLDISRQAVAHLASLGHRRIAYLGGDDRISNSGDRFRGFRAAIAERRLDNDPDLLVAARGWKLDRTEADRLIALFRSADRPTAVFAGGFTLALDTYEAARAAGLRIPEDLSVVGVDDARTASYLTPPLTALRQPLIDMGATAVRRLVELLRDPTRTASHTLLRAQLIVRGSTSRPGYAADQPAPAHSGTALNGHSLDSDAGESEPVVHVTANGVPATRHFAGA